MKDFTLSEMKAHCTKVIQSGKDCTYCKKYDPSLYNFCMKGLSDIPAEWKMDIEPRDIIELPCKELVKYSGKPTWVVHYRDKKLGFYTVMFDSEPEADVFLAGLKDRKGGE